MERKKVQNTNIHFDDKKYDVFFTYMVRNIDDKYLDDEGKISIVGDETKFKCFSAQIGEQGKKSSQRKLFTLPFWEPFGYEFDINDRSFNVKIASYKDIASTSKENEVPEKCQRFARKNKNYIVGNYRKNRIYIWNADENKKNKIDLRDIVIPKLISRLEKARKILPDGKDINSITKELYEKTNSSREDLDKSFNEKVYGKLTEDVNNDKIYKLNSMNLMIGKYFDDNVGFLKHNEFDVFPKNINEQRIKPKRLVVNLDMLNFALNTNKISKVDLENFFKKKDKYSKLYGNEIRIVNSEKKITCLTTIEKLERLCKEAKMI